VQTLGDEMTLYGLVSHWLNMFNTRVSKKLVMNFQYDYDLINTAAFIFISDFSRYLTAYIFLCGFILKVSN